MKLVKDNIDAPKLCEYEDFWVLWVSCVDKPRTRYTVAKSWGKWGNPFAAKKKELDNKTVYEAMKEGFIDKNDQSKLDWLYGYYKNLKFEGGTKTDRELLQKVIEEWDSFMVFLVKNKKTIYNFEYIQLLFKKDFKLLQKWHWICPILPFYILTFINSQKQFIEGMNSVIDKFKADSMKHLFEMVIKKQYQNYPGLFGVEINLKGYFNNIKWEEMEMPEKLEVYIPYKEKFESVAKDFMSSSSPSP